MYLKTRQEKIRETAKMSLDDAVAKFSDSEKAIFDALLKGETFYATNLGRDPIHVGTPIYAAVVHYYADYLDLCDVIDGLSVPPPEAVQNNSAQASGLPVGGLPVGGLPVGGLPVGGLPVGGLPVGGLPGGLPGSSTSSSASSNSSDLAPKGTLAPLPHATLKDVFEVIQHFDLTYGAPRGGFLTNLVQKVLDSRNKDLVAEFLDKNWFSPESPMTISSPEPGKRYKNKLEIPKKEVPVAHAFIEYHVGELLHTLVSHPNGSKMFLKSDIEYGVHAVQFAFDTKNAPLLQSLVSTGLRIELLTNPAQGSAPMLVDVAYRAERGDEDCLDILFEAGCDPNALDMLGNTALSCSAAAGNMFYASYLLQHMGIDPTVKNHHGSDVSSLCWDGPILRAQRQAEWDDKTQRISEAYEESMRVWKVQEAQAVSKGIEPPKQPEKPKSKPRPGDYDLMQTALLLEAYSLYDPSHSPVSKKKAQHEEVAANRAAEFSLPEDLDSW